MMFHKLELIKVVTKTRPLYMPPSWKLIIWIVSLHVSCCTQKVNIPV